MADSSDSSLVSRINQTLYLVKRHFPDAAAIRVPPSLSSSNVGGGTERWMARKRELAAYEESLANKSPEELLKLYQTERELEQAQVRAKLEKEERERFYNLPQATADISHWSKTAYWSLDEAIALSFGKSPAVVNAKAVASYGMVTTFLYNYQQLTDLATRAKNLGQLHDTVLPGFYIAWAKRNDVAFPADLEAAIVARGVQVADWKTLHDNAVDRLKESTEREAALSEAVLAARRDLERLRSEAIDASPVSPDLKTRERDSLLKLVIGMAIGGYGFKPEAKRSEIAAQIATDLHTAGIALDVDTIRKWLQEAKGQLPGTSY